MSYSSIIFCQSKKIQIENLKLKIDSLYSVLSKNRDSQTNYSNQLLDSINKVKLLIIDSEKKYTEYENFVSEQKYANSKLFDSIEKCKILIISEQENIKNINEEIENVVQVDITDFTSSDLVHPYKNDGYYTLEGNYETNKRRISDKLGKHIGVSNYNWENFDESFYFEGSLFSGIIYVVNNKRLAEIGQIKNGKKSGLWVKCITDMNSENIGLIKEVSKFENGVLIKRKVKNLSGNDESCSNNGIFDFDEINPKISLTDIKGFHPWSDDFNEENGLYTLKHQPFSGIGYINESGACMTAIFNYENGHQKGFYILSNEDGYVSSFGEKGKTTGRKIENHYTGDIFKIENYTNNESKSFSLFFYEEKYVGNAIYENYQLINCKGTCE
jgi:hypothetical protein